MAITYLSGERIQGLSYTAASSATHAVSTTSGSVATAGTKSSRAQECGFRVNAGHALVGKRPITITIGVFRASGLTSGVMKIAWRRASDSDGTGTALVDSATVNNSTLSVGDYGGGNYNWGDVTFTFPSGAETIGAGDYFLTNATVATGNDIKNKFKNANTESYIEMAEYGASGVSFNSSYEFVATVVYLVAAVGDEKQTNVPIGTRFEETDTRKIFRRKAGVAAGLGSAADGVVSGASNQQSDSPHANLGTYSYSFAGNSGTDKITTGLTQNLGQQFSVAFWIKFTTVSNWRNIMGKGDTDNSEELIFYLDGNSSIGGEATPHTQLDSGFTPSTNTWYHVVYTIDGDARGGGQTATSGSTLTYGGEHKTYVDGVLKNTEKTTYGDGINDFGTEPLVLGYALHSGTGDNTRRLHGKLSQTLVYNDILTQAEITALYNGGDGVSAPSGHDLLAWYDFQESSGNLLNKQSTSAVPDD